jgi:lysophospholipase L1-like esterase
VTTSPSTSPRGASRTIVAVAGIVFLAGAALHNTWLVARMVDLARAVMDRPGVAVPDAPRVHAMQLLFLATGGALIGLSWVIGRVGFLDRWFRRPLVEKLLLAFFALAVPVGWLELGLRAFVPPHEKSTKIFVRDGRLGWRLRPGAVDSWGGVEVRINERGHRGPLVPYEKPPGARRVVYLGDSVTFGYRIARWEDTFPFVADSLMAARDSLPVETVNLSVEGYAQWQQYLVMADEGRRYAPDLVVIGFVLNDVTEMFHLVHFGGAEESFQLRHAYSSWLDRLLARSALVYEVENITREIKAKRRLGEDPRLGAVRQQMLEVETLMRRPDQPNVKLAWEFALADLQKIIDLCRAEGIPVLVVVFPYAVQLSDPVGLSAPQRVITEYARAHRFAVLDLLPELLFYARDRGRAPSSFFLDHDHLSAEGHRAVAEILADPIAARLRSRGR